MSSVDSDELRREIEAVDKELSALQERIEARRDGPVLEGDAVVAVWREYLVEANAEVERLERRVDELKQPVQKRKTRLTRRQWALGVAAGVLVPLVGVASWVWIYSLGLSVRLVYFEASVQVIPVIVIAAALQVGHFNVRGSGSVREKALNAMTLLWCVAGEAAAMVVLLRGHATALAFGLATNALVASGGALVGLALWPGTRKE